MPDAGPNHGDRTRNIGWRVDYFVISSALRPRLKHAWISPEIMGSDRCSVGNEIEQTPGEL